MSNWQVRLANDDVPLSLSLHSSSALAATLRMVIECRHQESPVTCGGVCHLGLWALRGGISGAVRAGQDQTVWGNRDWKWPTRRHSPHTSGFFYFFPFLALEPRLRGWSHGFKSCFVRLLYLSTAAGVSRCGGDLWMSFTHLQPPHEN